jgi:DNA-directed RNA polymerase II subunit RPB1
MHRSLFHNAPQTLRTEVMISGDRDVQQPVHLARLIVNAQAKFNAKPHRPGYTNLDPLYVIKQARPLPPFTE